MSVTKVIQNAFEQVGETAKDIAKSSVKQVQETLSPWDMIRNSFDSSQTPTTPDHMDNKEGGNKSGHTPLNFSELQKQYENQDNVKADALKRRLFRMAKQEDEQTLLRSKHTASERTRSEAYLQNENNNKAEQRRYVLAQSAIPEGKVKQSVLGGKKRKKRGTDVQPLEARPNSSKQ
jgi:hypothetical protein